MHGHMQSAFKLKKLDEEFEDNLYEESRGPDLQVVRPSFLQEGIKGLAAMDCSPHFSNFSNVPSAVSVVSKATSWTEEENADARLG